MTQSKSVKADGNAKIKSVKAGRLANTDVSTEAAPKVTASKVTASKVRTSTARTSKVRKAQVDAPSGASSKGAAPKDSIQKEIGGKRLLMETALRLCARSRSICSLGLRELAREAGLNPNTFYRHFKDMDDLGVSIIESMVADLRQPLRELRRKAAESVQEENADRGTDDFLLTMEKGRRVNQETVRLFFNFVEQHPDAFVMGVRELHGASSTMREALRKVMADFAKDMADDIRQLGLLPFIDDESVRQVGGMISRLMFHLSMEYVENPDQRESICEQAESHIVMLTLGASTLATLEGPMGPMLGKFMQMQRSKPTKDPEKRDTMDEQSGRPPKAWGQ